MEVEVDLINFRATWTISEGLNMLNTIPLSIQKYFEWNRWIYPCYSQIYHPAKFLQENHQALLRPLAEHHITKSVFPSLI